MQIIVTFSICCPNHTNMLLSFTSVSTLNVTALIKEARSEL